jgi:hypothetical protein
MSKPHARNRFEVQELDTEKAIELIGVTNKIVKICKLSREMDHKTSVENKPGIDAIKTYQDK